MLEDALKLFKSKNELTKEELVKFQIEVDLLSQEEGSPSRKSMVLRARTVSLKYV